MSASPSPSNPGEPKKSTVPPKTTNLARYGPRIFLGGVLLGVTYAYLVTRPPAVKGAPGASFITTPGVQNIENAYANAGATKTHTKAYGGTRQGTKDEVPMDRMGTGRPRGFDTEGLGKDQRPQRPFDGQN